MRRISFYNSNRSDNVLHIETEGCIVNIHVNLHDTEGRQFTAIEITPDKYAGEEWDLNGRSLNHVIKKEID